MLRSVQRGLCLELTRVSFKRRITGETARGILEAGSPVACIYHYGLFRYLAVFSVGPLLVTNGRLRAKPIFGDSRTLAARETFQEDALCAPFAAS